MAGEMAWAEGGGAAQDEEIGLEEEEPAAASRRETDPFGPEVRDEPEAGAATATASGEEALAGPEGDEGLPPEEREDAPGRPRAPRPSHWDQRKIGPKRSPVPFVLAGLLVLGAGAGAWWFLAGPGAGADFAAGTEPAPPIPPELAGTLEEVGSNAYGDFLAWTDEVREEAGLGAAPGQEWLQGRYFASASDFPRVREYWEAWADHLDRLRESDEERFMEAVDARLAALEGLPEGGSETLRSRLGWEFRNAGSEREAAYATVGGIAEAALDFHELLVRREGDIEYDPASSGVSQDPILEVVPSDEALREEMNEGIDAVLRSIGDAGVRTPLSTEGLVEALREGLVASAPFPPPDRDAPGDTVGGGAAP